MEVNFNDKVSLLKKDFDNVLNHVFGSHSTRLEGMAGAGLRGSDSWVAIPFADLRGGEPAPVHSAAVRRELHELGQAL